MDKETNNQNITDPALSDEDAFFQIFNTPEANMRRELRRQEDYRRDSYRATNEGANKASGIFTGQTTEEFYANSRSVTSYRKIAEKSKGQNKKTNSSHRIAAPRATEVKVIDTTKITQKIAIILSSIAIVIALGTIVAVKEGPNIKNSIETRQIIKQNTDVLKSRAMFNLLVNNLAEINPSNGNITIKNNTTEDYWKLNITNEYDIYAYSLILSSHEFNKFIQAVTYKEGIAYISASQFLSYNGYIDPKDNNYKLIVFQNLMEQQVADIPSDVMERYQSDPSILTYGDLIDTINAEKYQGKGGK